MGIYFLAAGTSTKNREKSLDKDFTIHDIQRFLNQNDLERLQGFFSPGEKVYIWGATEGSLNELDQASSGEYVVDVKDNEVVQIFTFCFVIDTRDSKELQEYIGWDRERPNKKRHYRYIYFLKSPRRPREAQKKKFFFQNAFDERSNHWLDKQKWFSGSQVSKALERTGYSRVEGFLGITS